MQAALLWCVGAGTLAAQTEWRSFQSAGSFAGPAVYDTARDALVLPVLGSGTWLWRDGTSWQSNSGPTPPARLGYALCHDAQNASVLLFGGEIYSPIFGTYLLFSDLWSFDATGWHQLTSVHQPPGRSRTAMAIEPATGLPILHGGLGGVFQGFRILANDTWRWQGTDWVRVGSGPYMGGHSMASGPATGIVMFGGNTTPETWTWGFPAGNQTWVLQSPAQTPSPRFGHAMSYDTARDRVVLHGGVQFTGATSGPLLGDLWEWDGQAWSQPANANVPPPRSDAAMAYDPLRSRLLLGGGMTATATLSDLWQRSSGTWRRLESATTPGVDRDAAVAWDSARNALTLFGGRIGGSETNRHWELNGNDWSELPTVARPSPRASAALAGDTDRGRLVLFGGSSLGQAQADHWEWDGVTWQQLQLPVVPPARSAAGMVYDTVRRRMVLFGGLGPTGILGDTWQWDGVAWTQQLPQQSPSARYGPAMAFDSARGVAVLFGGVVSFATVNDTWEWDGTNWSPRLQSQQPPVNTQTMAMAFDRHRQRCVLAGITSSNVLQTWDWDGNAWTQLLTGAGPPQFSGPAAYDPLRRMTTVIAVQSVWRHGAIAPADVTSFGSACGGASGLPTLSLDNDAQPWLGDTLTARIASLPLGAPVLLWLGTSRTQWGTQTLPQPLDLYGMPGCVLATGLDDASRLVFANATGEATVVLSVPTSPSLVGIQAFAQAGAVDVAANAAGFVVTNALALQIGSR